MLDTEQISQGIKKALPIVIGYFPLGLAFGVIAQNAGFSWAQVALMSLLVFSGSGQFIAVALISMGASLISIILTILLVNSRYFLFSAALSPFVRKFPAWLVALISQEITDETFVVSLTYFQGHPVNKNFWLSLNLTSHLSWIGSTVLGAIVGNFIPHMERFGLNFALPAMFIALLFMTAENRQALLIGLIAGMISLIFVYGGFADANVILATVIAATLGVFLKRWKNN